MVLVDTNVLAILFLVGPSTDAARALLDQDDDWRSEAYTLIELSNVLTTSIRVRGLALARAQSVFREAQALIDARLVVVAHADAIAFAHKYQTSAYDARFLVAARDLGVKLVTEDSRLRRSAPALTQSIDQALSL